jgi:hypothetical protein
MDYARAGSVGRRAAISIGLAVALVTLAFVTAATSSGVLPPGGPAPKQLVGKYTATLSGEALRRVHISASQNHWLLTIQNKGISPAPRVLDLFPVGSGGPSIAFGVSGNHIYLGCLNDQGLFMRGHSTYMWSVNGRTLTFKLVRQPCTSSDDRTQPTVLTSQPWHKR